MRTIAVSLALLVLGSVVCAGSELPVSVFVVHCEPSNANEDMWLALVELVSLADQHRVPLSIDFTAQWAQMALDAAEKVAAIASWIEEGHEIACHHHAYWSTMSRGAQWDGYTNTALQEILAQDRVRYCGTMEDYLALLEALPGERRSGCLGRSDGRDEADWPCSLVYSTRGHALEDATSIPTALTIGGCAVWEIGHGLILSAAPGELRTAYESADPAELFGVVGHVYNYAALPMAFSHWFSYLSSVDPEGSRRGTVSGVLDAWLAAP
jgi:hypothetical protein